MNPNNPLLPIVTYVEGLETQVDQLNASLSFLQTQVGTLNASLSSAESDLAAAKQQIAGMIPAPSDRDVKLQKLLDAAHFALQLGSKYVFGGEPQRNQPTVFDCSALMQACFAFIGVVLPRVSANQAKCGTEVALSDALPGDLCAFNLVASRPGIDHVGLYLGNGQMLHTNTETLGIHISALPGGLVTVRRLF